MFKHIFQPGIDAIGGILSFVTVRAATARVNTGRWKCLNGWRSTVGLSDLLYRETSLNERQLPQW
jgi:hypothetical protein